MHGLQQVIHWGDREDSTKETRGTLNELLKAGKSWRWTPDCKNAFTAAKEKLSQAPILAHFDPAVLLRLAGDASAYGIGAVLSHLYHDGTERPIAYASCTLTPIVSEITLN